MGGRQVQVLAGEAGSPEPMALHLLRISFGCIWIFDGILQAQVSMPLGMASGVMQPAVSGSPSWVVHLVNSAVKIWNDHPVPAAASAVWIQVGIGFLLLFAPAGTGCGSRARRASPGASRSGSSERPSGRSSRRTDLAVMKRAMWSVDPVGGTSYAAHTDTGQEVLFIPTVDSAPLLAELRATFGTRWFTPGEAVEVRTSDERRAVCQASRGGGSLPVPDATGA